MSKLVMLKGLPASGKSTYAKELVKQGYKRVNKDDLRAMIDNGKWSNKNEEIVKSIQESMVHTFIDRGYNVVVDDTNFAYEDKWKGIASYLEADFEIKYFDTPVQECIKRDMFRGDKTVGADVIQGMYRKYIEPHLKKPEFVRGAPYCYIVDIDGTIARMKDRRPYDWHLVGNDEPIVEVISLVNDLKAAHKGACKVILLSGRDSVCRSETIEWLAKQGVPYDELYMRPQGDMRKDCIIKKELYDAHVLGKFNVLGVFDDRDQVVELWRSLGLQTYQCNYGNF